MHTTMIHQGKLTAVLSAILVLAMGSSMFLLTRIDRTRTSATQADVMYLPSAGTLRRLSLGYTGLMADIYWTRTVQYFGDRHRQHSTDFHMLSPLLDLTTALDPKLIVAYEFGASFLGGKPPEGAGQPEKAAELVEKGIRENPNEWRLYYALGFLHYMERKDYAAAASAFERGSHVPGAHPSLKILAAAMAQHAGDLATARLLWTTTYQTTQDSMIRENALKHLQALRADEDVDQLEALVQAYHQRSGRFPASFNDLIAAGMLRGIPVDPLGRPYLLRPQGRIEVQHPDDLPFITRGLPPGKEASIWGLHTSN